MMISNLKVALASKEKELHDQHEELVHLRQAEEALVQAKAVECKRLRVLADSLVCKLSFLHLALLFLYLPVVILVAWCSLYGCECDGGGCIGVWSSSWSRGCHVGCCCSFQGCLRPGFYSCGSCS